MSKPLPYNPQNFETCSREKRCLYIEGDPKKQGAEICGKRQSEATAFCAEHHALCWREAKTPTKEFQYH